MLRNADDYEKLVKRAEEPALMPRRNDGWVRGEACGKPAPPGRALYQCAFCGRWFPSKDDACFTVREEYGQHGNHEGTR